MDNPSFILYSNKAEINNITSLKEFNTTFFTLEIDNQPYIIKGEGLELKEVSNNNSSIIITGVINLIEKKNYVKVKNKSFIKRLFS